MYLNMPWAALVFTIVGVYAFFKLTMIIRKQNQTKFWGLAIAASIFVVMQVAVLTDVFTGENEWEYVINMITEWGHIVSLAFILSSLAVFIRDSSPKIARFPLLYPVLPFFIILSYFLVRDTYILKHWLLAFYQGGALLLALIMYSSDTYNENEYAITLFGIIIILISYILFWFVPGMKEFYSFIWEMILAIGIVVTIMGCERTELELS